MPKKIKIKHKPAKPERAKILKFYTLEKDVSIETVYNSVPPNAKFKHYYYYVMNPEPGFYWLEDEPIFVGTPFFVSWLSDQSFRGAGVAFYASCAMYIVFFCVMVACVRNSIDKIEL